MNPMDSVDTGEGELIGRLRQLDAVTRAGHGAGPGFDYDGLLQRQEVAQTRARRRRGLARGTASALALAMVTLSIWRLSPPEEQIADAIVQNEWSETQPRLVRADTYLALAALEDHIATIDDALNDARVFAPSGAEVARLERTRAELMDSYARVRYAEMVSNNF